MSQHKKQALDQAQRSIAAIRALLIDAINGAKSGHPGMALDVAPALYALYHDHLKADPEHPDWFDRDRFVLSSGHNSALLYSVLHYAGYGISLDDMKAFRKLGSKTPGHPEVGVTPGVDATSGPLGQGVAQAVGFALAEQSIRDSYPESERICDHYTYCLCGDGCLMEGVTQEAISLAGHLRLNKLILIYDANGATLDGPTSDSFDENVELRFRACNWDVIQVEDGNDRELISKAIKKAKKNKCFPTLIILHTKIGYGTVKEGSHSCHGSPLGKEDGDKAKAFYGASLKEWAVDPSVYEDFKQSFGARGKAAYEESKRKTDEYSVIHPQEYETLQKAINRDLRGVIPDSYNFLDKPASTRAQSGEILKVLHLNGGLMMMGGSADVAGSVQTNIPDMPPYGVKNRKSHDIHFGIREFAMASCVNGMALHGGLIPYCAAFMVFADYLKPAMRMAAIEKIPSLFLFSHDSIAVGEDGPTHQPIDQLPMMRAIPGLRVYRPADGKEVLGCYRSALAYKDGPSAIILSRQNLPQLKTTDVAKVEEGAYCVYGDPSKCRGVVLASGSEVSLAIEAAKLMRKHICVYSVPCLELLEGKNLNSLFVKHYEHRVSLEMSSTMGWAKYAKYNIGIDSFGASGKAGDVMAKFGFTPEAIAEKLGEFL